MAQQKRPKYLTILESVIFLRTSSLYNGRWIKDEVLIQLLSLHNMMNIDTVQLRKAFSHASLQILRLHTTPNDFCIYNRLERNRSGRVLFFYFTKQTNCIPPSSRFNKVVTSVEQFKPRRSPRTQLQPQDIALNSFINSIPTSSQTTIQQHSLNNQHQQQDTDDEGEKSCSDNSQQDNQNHNKRRKRNTRSEYTPVTHPRANITKNMTMETKWDSPEAASLFVHGISKMGWRKRKKIIQTDDKTDVKQHVMDQIQRLRMAYLSPLGWKDILDDHDDNDTCTPFEIFSIQLKAKYLAVTLSVALEKYASTVNFLDICDIAIKKVNELDGGDDGANLDNEKKIQKVTDARTIMQWLRNYRRKSCFPNPSRERVNFWKCRKPVIFSNNPDLYCAFMAYANDNLSTLSGEMMHTYLFQTALPELANKIRRRKRLRNYTVQQLLEENGVPVLTLKTVYNWLNRLGFSYDDHRKIYFVDSHEKVENVRYRSDFIKRYAKYELKSHRWISIPINRFESLVRKGELMEEQGYKYENESGETYVELHVDSHFAFQDECNRDMVFGGGLSVRRNECLQKPLIIFGQDECIFKQYNMSKKGWTAPDGRKALVPKDEGQGVMVSSFVSREFGYGMSLSGDDLDKVNRARTKGVRRYYKDEKSAIAKLGTTKKAPLTESPFTRFFEYGQNNDGYWTYESMVLQLEDVVDCLTVLYPDYEYLFLFDHSNGHDRLQPNGLNVNRVNKYYGGKQAVMRDSVLNSPGCFGPYHNETFDLQLGSTQRMVYKGTDPGPFYMGTAERESRREDKKNGKVVSKYIKRSKLIEMLKVMKVMAPVGCLQKLRKQCVLLDLPIKYSEESLEEGWVGKPKGSLQLLYERGWIRKSEWRRYTEKGQLDEMGIIKNETSLKWLLRQQPDFVAELTLLQYYGREMGVNIDRTPKCHPELAGEGVEYTWALAKLYYRNAPINRKRRKDSFRLLVNECLSRNGNLQINRIRKCSRRARDYIVAYKAIEEIQNKKNVNKETNQRSDLKHDKKSFEVNYHLIEKAMKLYKTHRNAGDFDAKFVKNLNVESDKLSIISDVVLSMKGSF
jgi:hypothetical protein